ncbi:Probable methionine--tRNA ligase [Durusdinium trenchii]|uniref:methionine--tRNA ligase n=1 Tax=Durusdinium trenchii TaxID=1381693 RepID=A0ABP0HU94_9DINO
MPCTTHRPTNQRTAGLLHRGRRADLLRLGAVPGMRRLRLSAQRRWFEAGSRRPGRALSQTAAHAGFASAGEGGSAALGAQAGGNGGGGQGGGGPGFDRGSGGKMLVTTPIFYCNGLPHIGHAYSSLLADGLARYWRLAGRQVVLATGTDEHGSKVEEAARAQGFEETISFCDHVSGEFRKQFDALQISYDDFIRTTEERHAEKVEALWRRLHAKGAIVRGSHEGWYCQSDEAFLTDKQVEKTEDGKHVSAESGHAVEWLAESNLLFKLSDLEGEIKAWLESDGRRGPHVVPQSRLHEMLALIEAGGLRDLSVSRPRDRVGWALPVPDDSSQSIYVWLDALTNYLTTAKVPVNPDPMMPVSWKDAGVDHVVHVIGKDILRFHTVYWPGFLIAAGIEPPDQVFVHGHWTVNGTKMSKSLGNVINPADLLKVYEVDAVRYALLRNGGISSDLDFSLQIVHNHRRDDLANTYGNLLTRCVAHKLLPDPVWPGPNAVLDARASPMLAEVAGLPALAEQVSRDFEQLAFARGLESIMRVLASTNAGFTSSEPWVKQKQLRLLEKSADHPGKAEEQLHLRTEFDTSLFWMLETLRVCSILLIPAIPTTAHKALDALGIPFDQRTLDHAQELTASHSVYSVNRPSKKGVPVVLLPRLPFESLQEIEEAIFGSATD